MINGEMKEMLSASDRGLHYGDGLFETIAVVNGCLCLWSAHMERLQRGCERLGIPLPDLQQLHQEALSLCGSEEHAVLKLIITRGSGGRGYRPPQEASVQRILFRYPWPDYPDISRGIQLRVCQTPLACNPALAGIKHLNRLEQVMARAEWDDVAIHEGLMCDLDGRVKEGTMSNLFWIEDSQLFTPDLSRCGVAGVMRAQVMTLARDLGIRVTTAEIYPEELVQMDEIFMTNSLIGIWPVAGFAGRDYLPGELTQGLQSVLQANMEGME